MLGLVGDDASGKLSVRLVYPVASAAHAVLADPAAMPAPVGALESTWALLPMRKDGLTSAGCSARMPIQLP